MWARTLVLVGLLAGCDQVFGLDDRAYPDASIPVEPCPTSYSAVNGAAHVYRLSMEMATWRDAETDCESDSTTHVTHLVTWSDVAELRVLQAAYGMPSFIRVHVGYARNLGAAPLQKESFVAVTDGTPAPLDSWAPVEPNNQSLSGPETVTSVTGAEDLADDYPGIMRPYVCSCDGKMAVRPFDF